MVKYYHWHLKSLFEDILLKRQIIIKKKIVCYTLLMNQHSSLLENESKFVMFKHNKEMTYPDNNLSDVWLYCCLGF